MTSVKKFAVYGLIFILAYLVIVIAIAPADKIISKFSLPENVKLVAVSGSIYSGSAKALTINNETIENINWSFNFTSLFTLNPSVDVSFGSKLSGGPKGTASLSNIGPNLLVKDASVKMFANEIAPRLALPIDINAGGEIHLNITEFSLGKPVCGVANGYIQWDKAHVNAMEEDVELGTLKVDLGCDKGILNLTVDPNNDLGLEFTAYLANFRKITGQGYITPGAKFPENVKPLLGFIGKKDLKGRYKVKL
ncbi:type II secretion system protein N [Colwelliaceae bacterium BS250]